MERYICSDHRLYSKVINTAFEEFNTRTVSYGPFIQVEIILSDGMSVELVTSVAKSNKDTTYMLDSYNAAGAGWIRGIDKPMFKDCIIRKPKNMLYIVPVEDRDMFIDEIEDILSLEYERGRFLFEGHEIGKFKKLYGHDFALFKSSKKIADMLLSETLDSLEYEYRRLFRFEPIVTAFIREFYA